MIKYFLLIDGLNGGSVDPNHQGWFEIDDFAFEVNAPVPSSSGGSAGKANFSLLTVSLDADVAPLLALAADRVALNAIRIEGVDDQGRALYDLTLAGVGLTSVADDSSGAAELTFDYGKIGLVTQTVQANGSLTPNGSFGFDLAQNVAIDPATLPSPSVGTNTPGASAATRYFLAIDGLNGGSTDVAHRGWFEIANFNFDAAAIPSDPTRFSPLDVALTADLTGALADLAEGRAIRSVRVEGVTATGQAVYDLTLANVFVTAADLPAGGGDTLSFGGYQQIGLVTQQTDGSPASSFGFDVVQQAPIDPSTLAAPTIGSGTPGAARAAQYFMAIDGLNGGSLVAGHLGWFQIAAFDFAASITPPSGSGGSGGKPQFSPLEVALPVDVSAPLGDLASGLLLPAVRIEGVNNQGQAIYDLTLNNVHLTGVSADSSGDDTLVFGGYQKVGLVTEGQNANGSLTPGQSFGFDLTQNVTIDPSGLAAPTIGTNQPGASHAARYFMAIDGLTGSSADIHHAGWFDVNTFTFGADLNLTALGGVGGNSFSPLEVGLTFDAVGSLGAIAAGRKLGAIEIEGVNSQDQALYDLTLNNAFITAVRLDGNGSDLLTIDAYSEIGLVTKTQNNLGQIVPAGSFGFDVAKKLAIDPSTLTAPTVGNGTPGAATAMRYFLAIDGLNGGSVDANHQGWFDIGDFSFEVDCTATVGGAAGKASFSALEVRLTMDAAGALTAAAAGTALGAIKIEGVNAAGQAVYDLTLADVYLTDVHADSGGSDALAFDGYQEIGLATQSQNQNGSPGPGDTFSFNVAQNAAGGSLPSPTVGNQPVGAAAAPRYFLLIDGLQGNTTDSAHQGWFDVDNFSFGVTTAVPPAGSSSGRSAFSPLDVSLSLDETGVLNNIAQGTAIPVVRLEGVTVDGKAIYDLTLTGVTLNGVTQVASGANTLSFGSYEQIGLITGSENQEGQIVPGGEFGFDVATLHPIDPNTLPCFCRGTLILTERGEVSIEDLAIGDRVVTLCGVARPIKWIGQRAYDGRFVAGNRAVLPIRIEAGGLDDGVPMRDLWVSPEHALYIDGLLVPAALLVNGATIRQVERIERVEYFHIELDSHDVILAEGTPAESFVDCDNRFVFQNAEEFAALYPDDAPAPWDFCAERLEAGSAELTAIREALFESAAALGHQLDLDPDLHLIVDGEIIRPDTAGARTYGFAIPAGSSVVWLASRSAVPAEVEVASRDIRRLGVAVERIALSDRDLSIEAWHGHATLCEGFQEDEASHRWTDGLARLPEAWLRSFPGGATLEVRLISTAHRYRLPPPSRVAVSA